MTKSAEKWLVPTRTWPSGGLRLVTDKMKNKNCARLQPRFKNHGGSPSPTPKEPEENIFYTQ